MVQLAVVALSCGESAHFHAAFDDRFLCVGAFDPGRGWVGFRRTEFKQGRSELRPLEDGRLIGG